QGAEGELEARRRLGRVLFAEHAALALALLAGSALLLLRGWGLGHARWLAVKVGLTIFLIVPLEGMHAWICHHWIARGLRGKARTSRRSSSSPLAAAATRRVARKTCMASSQKPGVV